MGEAPRLLVVDDKEENLYLLKTLLEASGYRIDSARNGAEALAAAAGRAPDLVVSDILMPVMDGFTLCRRWKADEALRRIPFVFYTATYTDPGDERFALSLGADAFILKPAEPMDFLALIQEVIGRAEHANAGPPPERSVGEDLLLKEYNVVLVRKLEEKVAELEKTREISRLNEERLRMALEAGGMGMWDWNLRDDLIAWSDLHTRLFGLRPGSFDGRYDTFRRAIHPDDLPGLETKIEAARLDGGVYRNEHRVVWPDGSEHWIAGQGRFYYDAGGDAVRMCGVVTDITERKQAEARNLELESQLAQAQKMESIGRLAGGVAHDFNNLLTVILGYSGMLLGDPLLGNEASRKKLREIQKAGERARDLTRQLLAFGRKQILEVRIVDLNRIIAGFQVMLERLIGEDIRVCAMPDPSLDRVCADTTQIEQILLNLSVNARDAMSGGGELTIKTSNCVLDAAFARSNPGVRPGRYVCLAVTDTGCGMDDATKERIFEPFFTTKEKGKGTGLGLSTVYGIVRQHDGYVTVDSAPGAGATFTVCLPAASGEEHPESDPQPEGPTSGGHETLLVVEDEPSIRALIQTMLPPHGYRILMAGDSDEAIRLSEEQTAIDLLLTDVVMPKLNGRQVYERVVARHPGIKVIFMSGYTDEVVSHHGGFLEGARFLQKPFDAATLVRKVRDVLDEPPGGHAPPHAPGD
jgi:PAS domain S-box-containing protein